MVKLLTLVSLNPPNPYTTSDDVRDDVIGCVIGVIKCKVGQVCHKGHYLRMLWLLSVCLR